MPKSSFIPKTVLFFSGILLFLFLLEAGMHLAGKIILFSRDRIEAIANANFKGLRVLCIGESTTYDGGVYSYPSWLQRILSAKKNDLEFKVINRGIPGIGTEAIVRQLKDNLDRHSPDIVIIMMGVNDSSNIRIKDIVSVNQNEGFLRNLKIYKLAKIIKLNISNRGKARLLPENPLLERKIVFLRALIEKDPTNPFARLALTNYYKSQGRSRETEKMLKTAARQNMSADELARVYADLARFYWEEERFGQIEKLYQQAIKENPRSVRFYCDLGIYYRDRDKYREAEKIFQKALSLEPQNYIIYDNFGDCYEKQGKHQEAGMMYQKAKELNPEHVNTAFELRGKEFREIGRYSDIEKLYKSILKIDPQDSQALYQLGKCYEKQEKFEAAEKMYKSAVEVSPNDYKGYGTLALFYQKTGQEELAQDYFKKAKEIKFSNFYGPQIVANYIKAKEIILENERIKLVWVQYPMWEVEPLEKILGQSDNLTLVDNEKIFKDGVNKLGYSAYFIDRFAGDFGHCTKEGNRLLADNIANAILKLKLQ